MKLFFDQYSKIFLANLQYEAGIDCDSLWFTIGDNNGCMSNKFLYEIICDYVIYTIIITRQEVGYGENPYRSFNRKVIGGTRLRDTEYTLLRTSDLTINDKVICFDMAEVRDNRERNLFLISHIPATESFIFISNGFLDDKVLANIYYDSVDLFHAKRIGAESYVNFIKKLRNAKAVVFSTSSAFDSAHTAALILTGPSDEISNIKLKAEQFKDEKVEEIFGSEKTDGMCNKHIKPITPLETKFFVESFLLNIIE